MTEANSTERPWSTRYVETWAEIVAQVLGQISGSPVPCSALFEAPAETPAAAESDQWILTASSGGLRGEMGIRLPASSAVRLAQLLLGEPAAPDAEITADHREAVLELLRQFSGLVVTALKPAWGDVQLHPEAASGPPSWPASSTAWLRIGDPAAATFLIELHLSAALVAALRAEKTEAPSPSATAASAPPSPPFPASDAASSPLSGKVNLDLLMDVELAVTLRFGSRRMLLREVLDLNPGIVVELDRQVQEPVDMLLDGRVVARGEVVLLDGNYGLRVTEIAPAT